MAGPAAPPPFDTEALRPVAGCGGADAIALARERNVAVALNDRRGCAVAPLLDAWNAAGFRLGPAIRAEALRLAGEVE